MINAAMRLSACSKRVFPFLLSMSACAQSFAIPQSTAKEGGAGSMMLRLDAGSGKAPIALQWRFIFPKGISVAPVDVVSGSAAESAKKSLTCSIIRDPKQPAEVVVHVCVLAGGSQPIRTGTIANERYRIAKGTAHAPATIRVEQALAVTAEMENLPIPDAEGVVIIQ